MKSVNPLFLDSTKPVGDKVVTNVELSKILLYDGESLYLEIQESTGLSQKVELREVSTKKSAKFKTQIWLKQASSIQYRFVIESAGRLLFASVSQESRAGQMILENWQPSLQKMERTEFKSIQGEPSTQTKGSKSVRENKSKTSKESFNPNLFNGIKSLLDDLL